MIKVLIVDDHPIVREGLLATLEDEADFEVVGAAGSVAQCLAMAASSHPDVVLLDLELPDMPGIEAIAHIARAAPAARVVIFTAYDTDERVLGAVRAGARGYLLKGAARDEIGRAVRSVAAGGSHLEGRVAARVLAEVRSPSQAVALSARERRVLRLVADGLSNKAIGEALSITERTAKFHVSSLLAKLEADNRAQAVARAVERGLLPPAAKR